MRPYSTSEAVAIGYAELEVGHVPDELSSTFRTETYTNVLIQDGFLQSNC